MIKSLMLVSLLAVAGCGIPQEGIGVEEAALGQSCNRQSEPDCQGLTVGASCEGTGHCRPDPDYAGACDCVVATPPPPQPVCHCSDGSAPGASCHLGLWTGTCRIMTLGQMPYCKCL